MVAKGIKRAIVLPDTQIPFHDKKSLKAVESFMIDLQYQNVLLTKLLEYDSI